MPNLPQTQHTTDELLENFTPEEIKYIRWRAVPQPYRQPATKAEFANILGKRPETLDTWSRKEGFWEAVYAQCVDINSDRLPEVMETLTDRAVEGSVQSIKLWLEAMGFFRPEEDLNVKVQQEQLVVVMDGSNPPPAQSNPDPQSEPKQKQITG